MRVLNVGFCFVAGVQVMVIGVDHTEMVMIVMVCIQTSPYKHVAFPSVHRRPATRVYLELPDEHHCLDDASPFL